MLTTWHLSSHVQDVVFYSPLPSLLNERKFRKWMIIASSPVFHFICYVSYRSYFPTEYQSGAAAPQHLFLIRTVNTHSYPYYFWYSSASHIAHGESWSQQKIAIYNLLFSFPNTLSDSRWRQRWWRWYRKRKNLYIYVRSVVFSSYYWYMYVWSTLRLLKSSVIRVGLIKFLSPRCGRHICNINGIKADAEMYKVMHRRFKANAIIFIIWNEDVLVK